MPKVSYGTEKEAMIDCEAQLKNNKFWYPNYIGNNLSDTRRQVRFVVVKGLVSSGIIAIKPAGPTGLAVNSGALIQPSSSMGALNIPVGSATTTTGPIVPVSNSKTSSLSSARSGSSKGMAHPHTLCNNSN